MRPAVTRIRERFSSSHIIIPLLLIVSGIIIMTPYLDFQVLLSQGDHGRDLYSFLSTSRGQIPYKDYWWVYGPLMPFYYSAFFLLIGISIKSILFAEILLVFVAGVFFFLIVRSLVSPIFAFLAALWFWVFSEKFFYTYNHTGGTVLLIIIAWALINYLKGTQKKYLIWGCVSIFLLLLVKLNIGICALLVFSAMLFVNDLINDPSRIRKHFPVFILLAVVIPAITIVIYQIFLSGLAWYEIRQCLPYLTGDRPYETNMWSSFLSFSSSIFMNIAATWPNRMFSVLVLLSSGEIIRRLFSKETPLADKKKILITLLALTLFFIVMFHEFLLSGVNYRTYWARPFSMLLLFFVLGTASKYFSKFIRTLVFVALGFMIIIQFSNNMHALQRYKIPSRFITLPRARVFVGNQPEWINTVQLTTRYLNDTLKDNENFFAIPYAPLYYYLTDKPSPTRQLIFFEHINIPPEQERKIIVELERNRINYIVRTNRYMVADKGMGVLGATHSRLLGKYIHDNFTIIQRFGDWYHPGGWGWNHGTEILKRTIPL